MTVFGFVRLDKKHCIKSTGYSGMPKVKLGDPYLPEIVNLGGLSLEHIVQQQQSTATANLRVSKLVVLQEQSLTEQIWILTWKYDAPIDFRIKESTSFWTGSHIRLSPPPPLVLYPSNQTFCLSRVFSCVTEIFVICLSKQFQTCQNQDKHVQIGSNMTKLVQTCQNWFKLVQIGSYFSKLIQTYLN